MSDTRFLLPASERPLPRVDQSSAMTAEVSRIADSEVATPTVDPPVTVESCAGRESAASRRGVQ